MSRNSKFLNFLPRVFDFRPDRNKSARLERAILIHHSKANANDEKSSQALTDLITIPYAAIADELQNCGFKRKAVF